MERCADRASCQVTPPRATPCTLPGSVIVPVRLLYLVTEDWYFVGHRLALANAARAAGFVVGVACRVDAHAERIRAAGIELLPLSLKREGRNPLAEARSIRDIARAYRSFRPDIVHHVALKPIVYGSIAARLARVPNIVNALTGLGYVFSSDDRRARWARPIVEAVYRRVLQRSRVILQNRDDLAMLTSERVLRDEQCDLIPGAGVDLNAFSPVPEPSGVALVVLPARMLRDKGVYEFVEAARTLKERQVPARYALVGEPDEANPASIPASQLQSWVAEGVVEWWGWQHDMAKVYGNAHLVCLPSYREGLPKALMEAAASARAVVTCDVPGCRDAIVAGESGLAVPARDARALADALQVLIVDPARRRAMAARGRRLAEERFSIERIAAETIDVYRRLTGAMRPLPASGTVASR